MVNRDEFESPTSIMFEVMVLVPTELPVELVSVYLEAMQLVISIRGILIFPNIQTKMVSATGFGPRNLHYV